jgi:exodeoxyribonuclease VII small subunit
LKQKAQLPDKPILPKLEKSITEINTLIAQMEQGELSLDQSLEHFERGIILINHCKKILQDAEQKVQILIQNNNQNELEPYKTDEK